MKKRSNEMNVAMKKSPYKDPELASEGRKKYAWHFAFAKKNNIIRNLEIIVACLIAFIAGAGMYGLFS